MYLDPARLRVVSSKAGGFQLKPVVTLGAGLPGFVSECTALLVV